MLSVPPNIKIGYRDYKVSELRDESAATHMGWHHNQKHLIEVNLNNGHPASEIVCTYIHEIIHGIFAYHGHPFESDEQEEGVTICIANGLTAFFKDNPEAVKWIMKNLGCPITKEKTSKVR